MKTLSTRQHYVFDAWNRMVAAYADDNGQPGDPIAEYRYDSLGRRIVKSVAVEEGPAEVTHFYLNQQNQVLEERDMGFGANAWLASPFAVRAAVVLESGKILAGGASGGGDFALVRYNADGSLDTSFGDDGYVYTDFDGGWDSLTALAVQADGRIVAAGLATIDGYQEFALACYDADGAADGDFGDGGIAHTVFASDAVSGCSLAIQSGGKIVVAGSVYVAEDEIHPYHLIMARFDGATAALDTNFGSNGFIDVQSSDLAEFLTTLVVQTDDKILVAGGESYDACNFILTRYGVNGALDTGFGSGGRAETVFCGSGGDTVSVAVQPVSGTIFVAGSTWELGFGVSTYSAGGVLDTEFGDGGLAVMDFNAMHSANAVYKVTADGTILVAGKSQWNDTGCLSVARFTEDGSLDEDFGEGGTLMEQFGYWTPGGCMVISDTNRILVSGSGDGQNGLLVWDPANALGPSTTRQYVASPRYIDAPIVRDTLDASGEFHAENRLYYLSDANYNVTAVVGGMVDESEQVTWQLTERYYYSPYGMATVCDADFAPVVGNQSAVGNTVLFAGRAFDPESGLDYYRARYYDAMMGRFTGRDPIGYAAGDENLYRYVFSDPANATDPEGLRGPAPMQPPVQPGRTHPGRKLLPFPGPPPIGPDDPYRAPGLRPLPYRYSTPLPPGYPKGPGPYLEPAPGTPEWEDYAKRCWRRWKMDQEELEKKGRCTCVIQRTDHKGNKYNEYEHYQGRTTLGGCRAYCREHYGGKGLKNVIWNDTWYDP